MLAYSDYCHLAWFNVFSTLENFKILIRITFELDNSKLSFEKLKIQLTSIDNFDFRFMFMAIV